MSSSLSSVSTSCPISSPPLFCSIFHVVGTAEYKNPCAHAEWEVWPCGDTEPFRRRSGGHRSACTRTHFSGLRLGTSCESDNKFKEAQHLYSLPFKGPIVLFGALVEYHPSSPKDQARIHQFGKKVLPGIFLGCDEIAGGIWKGDILKQTWKIWKVGCVRDFSSKNQRRGSIDQPKDDEFKFPTASGTAKLSGREGGNNL